MIFAAMNDLIQARKLINNCEENQNSYLNLGKCGITNLEKLPELFDCNHLETLILSNEWWDNKGYHKSNNSGENNKISSIPNEISNFKKLTKLIICGDPITNWEISNTCCLEKLTGLQELNLSYNQISDISFLEKLTCLKCLYLSYNQISDIRFLEKLTGLQELNLSCNQISDISFLEKLTSLKKLELTSSQISDYSFLENLKNLQFLDLGNNQISDYSFLENLKNLQSLNLGYSQISDYSFLENLKNLQSLDLGNNQISDIHFLENLTGLRNLDLKNNQIKKIPAFIFQLGMYINTDRYMGGGLSLFGNPIESPPLEIIKQGRQSILDWFEARRAKLNEIKIILIGEPKAGKTTLLKRLKDDSFNENEEQTDGVNIEDIDFGKCGTFKKQESLHDITGHFWDFGGQEIMNATHQFFLTKRSVYVLVLDARKDANNAEQIRDWVKRVRATGGDSPIIVLANQMDVNPGFGFLNERELQDEFPQIKYFEKISCKDKDNKNIELVKNKLAEFIPTAELFQTEIDERWILVKNKLQEETKRKYYLDKSQFIKICNEFNLSGKPEQKNAITFLHDLGQVLHFENLNLAEYYVLNPYWITYGAYQILTSKFAGENKGIVAENKLEFIVNEEEDKKDIYKPANYVKIEYSPNEIRFLTDILNEFKLCFWTIDHNHFIIPDLLDTTEPLDITKPIRSSGERIQFVYDYDYLPKSVIPNIMVEMHSIMKSMWRTGCVLRNDDYCEALITSYRNRISITVTGDYKKKREFMSVIRFIINSINQKLSNKPVELIPLPEVNDFVKYKTLLAIEKDGKTDDYTYYECEPPKFFNIKKLLEGIEEETLIQMLKSIKGDTRKIPYIERNIKIYFEDSQKKLDELIFAVKASDEVLSNDKENFITELSLIKEKLNERKSEKAVVQTIYNILCGVSGNFAYSIIKSAIDSMIQAL